MGLVAEASCTWCVAGKYQSGSGPNAAFWLYLLMHTLVVWMHMRGNIVAMHSMDGPDMSLVGGVKMTSALACNRSDRGGQLLMVWAWQVPDWGGSDR